MEKNELPKDWKWVKLSNVSEITSSRRIFQDEYVNEGIPFFRTKEIKELNEGKEISVQLFISSQKYNEIKSKNEVPQIGDILLSAVGTIGVSYIINDSKPFYFKDGNLVWIRNVKGVTPKFLHFNFEHFIRFKQNIVTSGSAYNALTIIKLKEFEIPLPPLSIQLAIVSKIEELFSEIENGIKSLFTAKEQLKKYRQSVLKWAFEGKLTKGLNCDLYDLPDEHDLSIAAEPETEYRVERNHNNQKNQKNHSSDKGELPVGWKWVKVSSLCKVVRGGSPRPAGDPKYYDGNIPFLKVADLTKDNGMFLTTFKYTIKEAGLHKTRQIKPNTLLLSNSGATLGVPKICMINATMNDGIAAFLELDEKTNQYLYYFWLSKTRELRNINMGAAQPNLNTDIIRDYPVPYCSFEEQKNVVQAIESRLSVADKMEESITQSLQQAEALKQSILKKAFDGRLV